MTYLHVLKTAFKCTMQVQLLSKARQTREIALHTGAMDDWQGRQTGAAPITQTRSHQSDLLTHIIARGRHRDR